MEYVAEEKVFWEKQADSNQPSLLSPQFERISQFCRYHNHQCFVETYCGNGDENSSFSNSTLGGFSNYWTTQGEKIEFYLYCSGSADYNTTLNITAFWVSDKGWIRKWSFRLRDRWYCYCLHRCRALRCWFESPCFGCLYLAYSLILNFTILLFYLFKIFNVYYIFNKN